MSRRVRLYVALVVALLLAFALTTVANAAGWSKPELYGAGAGVLVVFGLVAIFWIEMAPDGDLRRGTPR